MLKQFVTNLARTTSSQQVITPCSYFGLRYQSTDYSNKCNGLIVEPKNHVLWLKFSRPDKLNAITPEMYEHITETLTKVNGDKSIRAVVLTGEGQYYSSGNDLSNFSKAMNHPDGLKAGLTHSRNILESFVASIIRLEKFLVAAVNGPAVGIPVTTLGLCDYVVASDRATFQSPFTALGQCPEGCSSLTFPQILGRARSSELLLLNMSWTADKACDYGLVSNVIEHDKFHAGVDHLLKTIVKTCYPNSMLVSKSLVQSPEVKEKLLEVNKRECDAILDLWLGEECGDAIQKFFQRSKK